MRTIGTEKGLKGLLNVLLILFVGSEAMKVARAIMSNLNDAEQSNLQRKMEGRVLKSLYGVDKAFMQNLNLVPEHSHVTYPQNKVVDGSGLTSLSDRYPSNFFALKTGAIKLLKLKTEPVGEQEAVLDLIAIETLRKEPYRVCRQHAFIHAMNDDEGTIVVLREFDMSHYLFQEVWFCIERLLEISYLIREKKDQNVEDINHLMLQNGFDENVGIITSPLKRPK